MSDVDVTGRCNCGTVTFSIRGPAQVFQYCHCSRCRKNSGSAHAANLFVPLDALAWRTGEDQVKRFELPDTKWWCSAFCTTCGSAMPWVTRNGKTVVVPAGSLDDDPGVKPDKVVYFGSAAPWYVASVELPRHDELPPR